MKKIGLICLLSLVIDVIYGQKLLSGSLDSFKFRDTQFEVKWDFSNTNYKDYTIHKNCANLTEFLSNKYTVEEWENNILPNALKNFVHNLNLYLNEDGFSFSTNNDKAEYELIVAPEQLSRKANNTTQYIIRKKNDLNNIAVFLSKSNSGPMGIGSMKKLLSDAYEEAADKLGSFIHDQVKLNSDEKQKMKQKLKSVSVINYHFDFSKMKIENMNAKEYVAVNVYNDFEGMDKNYQLFCKKLELTFVSQVNKEAEFRLDNSEESTIEVVLTMGEVSEKGGHEILIKVIDKEQNRVIKRFSVSQSDGKLNTFQVLLTEQLYESANDFCRKLI